MEESWVNKKTQYFLILLTIIISFLFRYPTSSHIQGSDAHFYVFLADSINLFGQARWTIHPVSYFGQYPFSANAGYPLLLSSFSQMAGVPLELSTIIMTLLIALVGIIGMFLFLREMFPSSGTAILGAALFSLMPLPLFFSSGTITTRAFVIYIAPVFLFFLTRNLGVKSTRELLLALSSLLLMFLFHKTAYFFVPILLIYFISNRIYKLKWIAPEILRKYRIWWVSSLFIISLLAGIFLGDAFNSPKKEGFLEGSSPIITLINAAISLGGSANIVIIFGVTGVFYLLQKEVAEKKEIFITISIIAMLPTLQLWLYARPVVSTFLIIIGIYGLYWLRLKTNRKRFVSIALSIMIISIAYAGLMMMHWGNNPLGNDGWLYSSEGAGGLSASDFTVAVYSKSMLTSSSSFISNYWADARLFQSYAEAPSLPDQSGMDVANYLIYGHLSPQEIKANVEPISPTNVHEYIRQEGPYSAPELTAYYRNEIKNILYKPVDGYISVRTMENYNTSFILVNKNFPTEHRDRWSPNPRASEFFRSTTTENYRIFETERYSAYYPFSYIQRG